MAKTNTYKDRLIEELDYLQNRISFKNNSKTFTQKTDNEACFMLIDYIPVEIVIVDRNGKIIGYNRTKENSGRRLPKVGDRMYKDYAGKHKINMNKVLMNCMESGEIKTFSEQQYDNHWLSITIMPFPLGAVITSQDITKRKRIEEEKEKIQTQLFQSQKMDAVGTLAGGVAHDFNNLLTAIQGTLDMVMVKVGDKDALYDDLKEVQTSANRAADLTRQLLIFSRKHPIKFVPIDLNNVVDSLLKMLHRLIGEDIGISTSLDSNIWKIMADKGSIEQIIVNLVVNARDAMPDGGKLVIKTENIDINDSYCKVIPDARPGRFIRVTVSDDGKGMEKEILQHIFEPFYTTKKMAEGTGLGLSVVYGIVKQHGGWINVYSEPGEGTEFKIYLSAEGVHEGEEIQREIALSELEGHGEKLLVIEDERCVRDFIHRALAQNGYQVSSVDGFQHAVNIFKEQTFDMVISDVVLPDGNGLELIVKLLKSRPELKILLTSGYTDKKSQWINIQTKGIPFLQKPFALFNLLKAVKEAINQTDQ